jgi:hypothetical protein
MKQILFLIAICYTSFNTSFAYNYGEHEIIGNRAMYFFYLQTKEQGFNDFMKYAPLKYDETTKEILFSSLSVYNVPIGYGTLNALSGDHAGNPLELEQELLTQNSYLLKVIALQNQYTSQYYSAAPDAKLVKVDPNYLSLAFNNKSHFYNYGKGFKEHFRLFNISSVDSIINPSFIAMAFKKLHATNAINMYVTLHTAAIYLAELAGAKAKLSDNSASRFLHYALLYNAFADHFLEDAFSSGHLLVSRSRLSSVINNKSLHDFYCKNGSEVMNINGEAWKAYGDNFFNQHHNSFNKQRSLSDVQYKPQTEESNRIINAIIFSISEIREAFQYSLKNATEPIFSKTGIAVNQNERLQYFATHYKALSLIPLPYNSNITELKKDSIIKNSVNYSKNQIPYLRNFVRSRIANSIVAGVTTNFLANNNNIYFQGLELRLNVGLINSKYNFNSQNTKKGQTDVWHGYTISYTSGQIIEANKIQNGNLYLLKFGLRSNVDYWVSNKRFLGVYAYNEVGFSNQSTKYQFVYVPQIGVQLGSMLNINYYNIKPIFRIPLQLFLPLKFKAGAIISPNKKLKPFSGVEIDLAF